LATTATTSLAATTAQLQSRSALLRKELGIGDLVLAQVLAVVVPDFLGTAVKAGSSHVILWLLAILLFFVPQGLLVSYLSRLMPLEGGLYEWTRLAFNDGVGFLVAWNIWLFGTLYTGVIGMVAMTFLAYSVGPEAAWMAANKWLVLAASLVFLLVLMIVARLGLRVGKWIFNFGGLAIIITLSVLILMPFVNLFRGSLAEYHPLQLVRPPLNLFHLNVFSKMTFGALTSLEYVAVYAGECRNPGRNLSCSIAFSAPLIAALYVLSTSSILAYVSPDAVDVIGPIPQALGQGLSFLGFARFLVAALLALLLANYFASFSINFGANVRLPMVAGWDHLLPGWFSRLHEKYKTPVNSILFVGCVALLAILAALFGVGVQEAYELLLTWSFTFYGFAYLGMFAIPLFAKKQTGLRPPWWLRLTSASGFLVTLLFVLFSVLPIIPVANKTAYAVKTFLVLLATNALGVFAYRLGQRKRNRLELGGNAPPAEA
jgi:glutamate:GABA antiporter